MTLEEFTSLNLERQSTEIKAIIEKAKKEFNIEVHLSNVKQDLCNLAFKYKINSSGIKVITNDSILIENIQKIMLSLSECKESEASEPFKPEIEALELRLTETTKKINSIKKVEKIFNVLSEVSASYSLDLQLGKFQHKVCISSKVMFLEREMIILHIVIHFMHPCGASYVSRVEIAHLGQKVGVRNVQKMSRMGSP